jgi:predicted permease
MASAAQAEAYRLYVNSSTPDDPAVPLNEFALQPLSRGVSRLRDQVGGATGFALACGALLALMICANLSGLLLARVISRRRELSVLCALGASRARLAAVILTEAALIVLGGSLFGAALTLSGVRLVAAQLPPVRLLDNTAVPMALNVVPDWRVFVFATVLCLAAFVMMAVAPAWRAAQSDPGFLREGSSGSRTRGWKWLVAVQMALCTALLFGTAAIKATLDNLLKTDPGMAVDRVIAFTVDRDLLHSEESQRFMRTASEWREKVRGLPGVTSASITSIRLMRGSGQKMTVAPAGGSVPASDFMNTSTLAIGTQYFETLGQRLVEGRLFSAAEYAAERAKKVRPVVVNQAFLRRFGSGIPMPGRKFGFGAGRVVPPQIEVIGVVTDAKYRSMREPVQPTVYSPITPEESRITLLVRTKVPPQSLGEPVRAALQSLDPTLLAEDVSTLEQDVADSLWPERALLRLSDAFAAVAALVAGAGLAGLMIFLVASRTREIAVRVAVGAARRDIWTLVIRDGLVPVFVGLVVGCATGFGLVQAAKSMLYGVSTTDPYFSVVAAGGVTLIGLVASVIPAVKALRVEPAQALREN